MLPQRYKFSSKSQLVSYNGDQKTVVVATAKVQIFKQITTLKWRYRTSSGLLLLPQRYKFSSKSQPEIVLCSLLLVVVATAKVQIFKQITTGDIVDGVVPVLLLLPQRYKFSSKSQQRFSYRRRIPVVVATAKVQIFKQITTSFADTELNTSCCCYRKGTNFQANHNTD